MPNVLSPNPIEMKGLNPMAKVYEKQKRELGGVPLPGLENSPAFFLKFSSHKFMTNQLI